MNNKQRLVMVAVFAITLAINVRTLMSYPTPFVDEVWNVSRTWAFIETGRQFGALDAGVFDRFEGHWTLFSWLPTFIQALGLRLVAQPELLPVRIISLVFGFLLLGAVYAIANRLYDWRHGILSVFLVSISMPFLYSAHLARTDIMTAALGFAAIALYLNNRSSRPSVSLLSGLCVALAFEFHANGIIYAPAIAALYFLRLGWSMFRRPQFWAFVGGMGAGFALYAALHVLPYPQTYLAVNQLAFSETHTPPLLTLDPGVIVESVIDVGSYVLWYYHLLVPIIIWAGLFLVRRRDEADKTLLVLSGALIGSAVLLIRNKWPYYAILYTPVLSLVVAVLMLHALRPGWHRQIRTYTRPALIWGLSITAILLNLFALGLRGNGWQLYQAAQKAVNQTIQPGDTIMAAQTYWLGLHDQVYYSWEELIYYQRYAPGSTLEDALREFQPDILIIDRHLDYFISDDRTETLYLQYLGLPRIEMEAFLDRNGSLVGEFDVEHYGPIRVYRITWKKESAEG